MTRGSGKTKELLTPAEREGLDDQKKELEATLKEKKEYGIGTPAQAIDEVRIKREIARIDKAKADREPPKLNGVERDKLAKEISELEGRMSVGIPSRDEMEHPEKNAGAVRKHMAWVDRNMKAVMRHKHLQRLLNPASPSGYEHLRRDK